MCNGLVLPSLQRVRSGERKEREGGRELLDLCKVRRIHFASEESDASSKGRNPADCIWLRQSFIPFPCHPLNNNRRGGFLEATKCRLARASRIFIILRELCFPVKNSFDREFTTHFRGRREREGEILISGNVFGWIIYSVRRVRSRCE